MHGFLDEDADATRPEPGDAHQRTAGPGDGLAPTDRGLRDELGRHLHAGHEVAGPDDLAVVDREHLQGIDPVQALQRRDPDAHDAVDGREQVDPALGRSADLETGTGDGGRETEARLVLVEIARLRDEHDERRFGALPRYRDRALRSQALEVVRRQAAALLPALTADAQVARQHGPDEIARRRTAGYQALEAHPFPVRPIDARWLPA